MSHSAPRRMRNGASTSFAAAISSACRRSASASSPGTTVTFGVWSQIAMYSYPRARAASPISSTLAFPSDHVVCTCRSPRISSRETSSGTSDVGTPSRSSGGTNGRPRRSKTPASSGASGSGSSAATHSGEPVARTSAVPNASGDATCSSTGMPSTVTPTFGATIATISGTESSSPPGAATASHVQASFHRRGSPAATPPTPPAIASTRARARCRSTGRVGAATPRSNAVRIRSSVFGPMPGTWRSLPSAAAARNSSTVRMPRVLPISTARCAPIPISRPKAASWGDTVRSSSRSSSISPVSTSSTRRASMPGPIPRSSRTRPLRTRSATGAGVARISSAARR